MSLPSKPMDTLEEWLITEPLVEEVKPLFLHYEHDQLGTTKPERIFHKKRVNVLVGPNNTGKSRFMRGLLGLPVVTSAKAEPLATQGAEFARRLQDETIIRVAFEQYLNDTNKTASQAVPRNAWKALSAYLEKMSEYWSNAFQHNRNNLVSKEVADYIVEYGDKIAVVWAPEELSFLQKYLTHLKDDLNAQSAEQKVNAVIPHTTKAKVPCTYVPLLRTASRFTFPLKPNGDGPLRAVASANLFPSETVLPVRIETGETLHARFLEMLTGDQSDRQAIRDFEIFLGRHFFQNKTVTVIPRWKKSGKPDEDHHLWLNLGGIERAMHELGDGLGMLVILLSQYFLAKEGSWIGIEEPELGLHPGFQRHFLEAILTDPVITKRNITTFFTTHSNHLLGVAAQYRSEVTIHSFREHTSSEGGNNDSPNTGQRFAYRELNEKLLSVLNDLGVHNSSVLLAGCSLWVEGPTDRSYLRGAIKAYLQSKAGSLSIQEDIDYVFLEYGGALLAHYQLGGVDEQKTDNAGNPHINAEKLANRIWLLVDRDETEKKDARFQKWRASVQADLGGFDVMQTEGIEIENELPSAALKIIAKKVLRDFLANPKSELDVGDEKDYLEVHMGSYLKKKLDSEFNPNKKPALYDARNKSRRNIAAKAKPGGVAKLSKPSGKTLSTDYKNKFAKAFLEAVDSGEITWKMLQDSRLGQIATHAIEFIKQVKNL